MSIPTNATIADVVELLSRPEDYVRGVLGNMFDYRKEHGTAVVRIGTTGTGKAPHYRVQIEIGDLTDFMLGEGVEADYFTAFHGRNHAKLDWGSTELRGEHWSTNGMTVEAVQELIAGIRGFRR
jgi:hypothetical protein